MFLARKHTASSYSEIGGWFGGRNHSTAVAAEKKVRQLARRTTPSWPSASGASASARSWNGRSGSCCGRVRTADGEVLIAANCCADFCGNLAAFPCNVFGNGACGRARRFFSHFGRSPVRF